jgi:hypothetical protein
VSWQEDEEAGNMISEQPQPEWIDLQALKQYARVSECAFQEAATDV